MIDKVSIFENVCEYYDRHYAEVKATGYGGCLYWMQAGFVVLQDAGLKPQIQAGSAHFPIVRPDQDDGTSATHWGFEWEPGHPKSIKQRAADLLPEMHCWLALIETNEVIDFSTHTFPDVARTMGFFWKCEPPPDFIWGTADKIPARFYYHANWDAIKFLHDFIKRKFIGPTKLKET